MFDIRRIPLEGAENTRDLGGLTMMDGRTIAPKRLLRSGKLYHLTEQDKRLLLDEYHLRQIVDLRTARERADHPDPVLPGVHVVPIAIFEESTMGISREAGDDTGQAIFEGLKAQRREIGAYMSSLYETLVDDPVARAGYSRFFGALLQMKEGATLWHCSAGKDRVGVATALLLLALGAPRQLIVQDYMMTGHFLEDDTLRRVARAPKEARQVVREVFGVREAYIRSVLDYIDGFGSAQAYLEQALGLGESHILALKSLYLV